MFNSKQKSHQKWSSDDLALRLLVNHLTNINPNVSKPKSQWLLKFRRLMKWN